MNILVSNDDGIFAPGILKLAESLSKLGQVWVVAPNMEKSASGHAITMHQPLRVKEVELPGLNKKAYSVDGTPADCVKMGIDVLMDCKPDLVATGINHGANLGTDVLYSGTVSAAFEGCIMGIPSAAFSLTSFETKDFNFAGETAIKVVKKILENPLPARSIINVNIPPVAAEDCRGFAITRLGVRKYSQNYIKRQDPRGRVYYWLAGELTDDDTIEDTDIKAVENDYVSITPLHLDLTDYSLMEFIKSWWKE